MPTTEDTQITAAPAKAAEPAWKAKAFDAAVKIAIPVLLAVCSWLFSEVQGFKKELAGQDKRLSVIEATSFTKDDGETGLAKIGESLTRLEIGLIRTTTLLDALTDKFARLEDQVEELRGAKGSREPPK